VIGIEELMDGRMEYLKSTPVFDADQPKLLTHQQDTVDGLWQLTMEVEQTSNIYLYTQSEENAPWILLLLAKENQKKTLELAVKERPYAYFFALENEKHAAIFPRNAPKTSFQTD